MKLKLLVAAIEKLFGLENDEGRKADMYLPNRLFAMGLAMIFFAVIMCGVYLFNKEIIMLIFAVFLVPLGIAAIICWNNQSITITSEDTFEYKTFLGNIHEYRFSDITGLRANNDSYTLFIGKNKVHIESMAILSDRLSEKIDDALDKLYGEERYYSD